MKSLRLLLAVLFLVSLAGGVQAFEKTVLIEYFSNDACGPCAGQHEPIVNMLEDYTRDEIAFITYHVSWPSPSDPYYQNNISENNNRRLYYGVNAVPWFEADGLINDNPLNGVLPWAVDRIGIYTPYEITISDLEPNGDQLPVTATLTCAEETPANMRFNLVMMDKHQVYPPGPNGIEDYRMNMLDMAFGADGQTFTSEGGNEELTFEYTFTIPDNETIGNIAMLAYVQNYSTSEIMQSRYRSTPEVNISGTVVHDVTGDPLWGAIVRLDGDPEMQRMTDEDGEFNFQGLGEGEHWFQVIMTDYITLETDPQFFPYGNHEVTLELTNTHEDVDMVGNVPSPDGYATGPYVSGGLAYVAAGLGGLIVADVSDPASPETLGSVDLDGTCYDVVVAGDYAYVASSVGLHVVDVSSPSNPSLAASLDVGGDSRGVVNAGDYVYMAASGAGLVVVDASNPTNPSLAASLDSPGFARDVDVDGDYAYLADGATGMSAFDISTPTSPTLAGQADSPGYGYGMKATGGYAYLADDTQGFRIYDVSDPSQPTEIGSYVGDARAKRIDVAGAFAFVAQEQAGFRVYNVANPNNIQETGFSQTPGSSIGVMIDGNFGYVADEGNLLVFDVTDAIGGGGPVVFNLEGVQTEIPAAGGQLVYNAALEYNLPNPTPGVAYWGMVTGPGGDTVGPVIFQPFTAVPGMDVSVEVTHMVPGFAPAGTYTYTGHLGFFPNSLIDDSFPFNKAGANTDAALPEQGWTASGGFSELAGAGEQEVVTLPEKFELANVYPNPFNPATTVQVNLPEAAELHVAVFNVMGRQVAELADGELNAGRHTFTFDASALASGLYFVRATVPGRLDVTRKIMLVR
ncbi:MAG: hypothetical protein MAG453_00209 [Calditrichaeota bacterium]|nr:hypothetical protein [Calditrichota bacterium]